MAKGQKKVDKLPTSRPLERLIEIQQSLGLEQFRAVLQRRQPDGTLSQIRTYSLPPDQLDSMFEWVPNEYGGGHFEVEVSHPMDPQQRFFRFAFDVEGEPIVPKRRAPVQEPLPLSTPQGQQVYFGVPPGISGFVPHQGHPYGGHPYRVPMQQAPARDHRLEGELAQLRTQNQELVRRLDDQRHADEMRTLRDGMEKQIATMKSGFDASIRALKDELGPRRKSEDSSMKEIFNMFMSTQKTQQDTMMAVLQRERDASSDQLKYMKEQMVEDLKFRREMYDMAAKSKDPSQAAALLDMMGNQTASMLNLINQAVSSNLLGGTEGDPAWLRAVQSGFSELKEFGQNLLAAKQHEAAMQRLNQPPQPGAPRFPPTRPGFGQPPIPPTPGARPPVPPAQPPAPAQPPPAAPPVPGASMQQPEPTAKMPPQHPPSLLIPIQKFCQAMAEGAPSNEVADMIHRFVCFLRDNEMMPPEWQGIFEDPKATLSAFFSTYVTQLEYEESYLDEICSFFQDLEKEYGPGEEEEPRPATPLHSVPTPPAPIEDGPHPVEEETPAEEEGEEDEEGTTGDDEE